MPNDKGAVDKGSSGQNWDAGSGGSKPGFFPKDWKSAAMGAAAGAAVVSVTRTGWLSRLRGAAIGVVLGIVLVPLAIWLVSWNEGRAVQTARSLTEGAGLVRAVAADRVDPAMEGRLVYVAGPLVVSGRVRDPDFGIEAPAGVVRLQRTVEMYQWRETTHGDSRTRTGGSQETAGTASYDRVWSTTALDSSHFRALNGHENPPMRYAARSFLVDGATVGAFRLVDTQLDSVGMNEPLAASGGTAAGPAAAAPGKGVTSQGGPQHVDGRIYLGGDPAAPQVGDMRIGFTIARPQSLSIVARQVGNGFAPYQTDAGDSIQMVEDGIRPAAAMFQSAQEHNVTVTWLVRFGGALLMFFGWTLVLRPIGVAADILPIVGTLVRIGTGLVALALTAIVAPITIAIAWFWVRPLLAGAVLAGGAAATYAIVHVARGRNAAATGAPAR